MHEYICESGMEALDVELIEKSRVTQIYGRGDKIFCQDEMSGGLYCIRSGSILLCHIGAMGLKTGLRVVGACEIMGYRSLFGEDPHVATAQALTTCHTCFYPKKLMQSLIDTYPKLAHYFLRALARDRGPRDALLLRAPYTPVRTRLIYLLHIMQDHNPSRNSNRELVIHLPLLRRDIASMLGARPESIARAIKELKQDGIAVFRGHNVTVPEPEKLYQEANLEASD